MSSKTKSGPQPATGTSGTSKAAAAKTTTPSVKQVSSATTSTQSTQHSTTPAVSKAAPASATSQRTRKTLPPQRSPPTTALPSTPQLANTTTAATTAGTQPGYGESFMDMGDDETPASSSTIHATAGASTNARTSLPATQTRNSAAAPDLNAAGSARPSQGSSFVPADQPQASTSTGANTAASDRGPVQRHNKAQRPPAGTQPPAIDPSQVPKTTSDGLPAPATAGTGTAVRNSNVSGRATPNAAATDPNAPLRPMTKKVKGNKGKRQMRTHEKFVVAAATAVSRMAAPVSGDALWTHVAVPTLTFVKDRINPGVAVYNIYKLVNPTKPTTHTVTADPVTHTVTSTVYAQGPGPTGTNGQPTTVTFQNPDGSYPTAAPTTSQVLDGAVPSQPQVTAAPQATAAGGSMNDLE